MLADGKIIEISCLADDFCKFYEARMEEYAIPVSGKRMYHRDRSMSKAKVMVVLIYCLDSLTLYIHVNLTSGSCKHFQAIRIWDVEVTKV